MTSNLQLNSDTKLETLYRQLAEKEKQIAELKAKLKEQEKLADLGMLFREILHDQGNALSHIHRSAEVTISRLEKIEQAFRDALFWIEKQIMRDFFAETLDNLLPKSKASLKNIKREAERIDNLNRSINTYMATENSAVEDEVVTLAEIGVQEFICGCLSSAHQTYNNRLKEKEEAEIAIATQIKFEGNFETITIAEPLALSRILLNLLNNAFYAVGERKQKEEDKSYLPKIEILAKTADDSIEISLEDNGGGMRIPFHKAFTPSISTKPKDEGTGLGLPIVQKLCARNKIRINANTESGESTKFTLFIPIELGADGNE